MAQVANINNHYAALRLREIADKLDAGEAIVINVREGTLGRADSIAVDYIDLPDEARQQPAREEGDKPVPLPRMPVARYLREVEAERGGVIGHVADGAVVDGGKAPDDERIRIPWPGWQAIREATRKLNTQAREEGGSDEQAKNTD